MKNMKAIVLCVLAAAMLPAATHAQDLDVGVAAGVPQAAWEEMDDWHGLRALAKGKRKGKGKGKGKGQGSVGQCGRPMNKCLEKNGKCMPKDVCHKMYGDKAMWVSSPGLCKSPLPADKCGCCVKREEKEIESTDDLPEELQLVPQGIAMAVEATGTTTKSVGRVEFSWNDDGLKDIKINSLGDGWSFHSTAGTTTKIDCDEKSCVATARGDSFHPRLEEAFGPIPVHEPEHSHGRLLQEKHTAHVFTSEMVPSTLTLTFPNIRPELTESLKNASESVEQSGFLDFKLKLNPTSRQLQVIEPSEITSVQWPFRVRWRLVPVKWIPGYIPPLWILETNKNLCVQPVRTRYRECLFEFFGICWVRSAFYTYSGDGLAFGRPGADDQWGKVDITFTWRDWITVDDTTGKYQSLTEAEMSDLRSEVSVDDCVEVFFVKKFNPSSTYGGGACWGSGTANAKIISSDEQVACGVDQTHLAHELGHALGLMHPGTGHSTFADGSTGTLLCGSGWQRDNPRRNSRDNGNNVVNPLLTTYFYRYDIDTHDCTDSADCGSCSAHIPSDSC